MERNFKHCPVVEHAIKEECCVCGGESCRSYGMPKSTQLYSAQPAASCMRKLIRHKAGVDLFLTMQLLELLVQLMVGYSILVVSFRQ